jgi:hypothetical protein
MHPKVQAMRKSCMLVLLLIFGAAPPMPSGAQDTAAPPSATAEPDLDALTRRIESAKAEAAKKEQARAAEAARLAAAKQQATLVIKADADCQLTVNGEGKGKLTANQTQSIDVKPGDQLIECVTTDGTSAYAQETKTVAAGAQAVVVLSPTAAIAARQQEAQQRAAAELVVKADADCQLTVNGEGKGKLTANQTQLIKVSPGEQLIECVTTDGTSANAQETKTVAAGAQAVVVLSLAAVIAARQQEAQQRAAAESAARNPGNLGFVDLGGGILKDTKTGLEWTQSDNGRDIDWNGARNHCAARGGSWRLPSVAELQAIYDANVPSPKVCWHHIVASYTCKVSPLFNLTGPGYWSDEASGSANAFGVSLAYGNRLFSLVGNADGYRTLCVRRPGA